MHFFFGGLMQDNFLNEKSLIKIIDRKKTEIDGVVGILAFDEKFIKLQMKECELIIEGNDMKIENMVKETEKILIVGSPDALFFEERGNKNTRKGRK